MQLSFEQRLQRFLAREDDDEERSFRELHSQPVELRVIEGECIAAARYLGDGDGALRFAVADNPAKFREGDAVWVSDGHDLADAAPMTYLGFDAAEQVLRIGQDRFRRGSAVRFEEGVDYVVDRRSLGMRGRLSEVVASAFIDERVSAVLQGDLAAEWDEARQLRAAEHLRQRGLNDAQVAAGARAIAADTLQLIQGPPGTGKTRLLAEVLAALCAKGCRVSLCAFTHRGVDNALLAVQQALVRAGCSDVALIKLGNSNRGSDQQLRRRGIQLLDPRRGRLPATHTVVAGTCYQLLKLHEREQFHYTVFDEAGQLPIPHALPGMMRSQRWLFFGDHQQLPPVVTAHHEDRSASASVFAHLHERYGAALLDVTYRMNEPVCDLVSKTFYGGRLHSAQEASGREMPYSSGGRLDEVLDPEHAVVWLRIDHRQPGSRSTEEANAAADVVEDLVRRHGIPARDIAVIAPFRAQLRMMRSALQHKQLPGAEDLTVDTVERIQGQEREVVVLSLTAGDQTSGSSRGTFHLNENRLNVAISRARTKVVMIASGYVFDAIPKDVSGLRSVSKARELRDRMHQVDLTHLYVS
jgi:DNA replication ATP-dependent helicase Dna2